MKTPSYILQTLAITLLSYSSYASDTLINSLTSNEPDIIYIADTNHSNLDLLSAYTDLVQKLVAHDPDFNCVLLESDKKIFQPAIDDFLYKDKTWEESIGVAQTKWEELTGRPYEQAPKEFSEAMKTLGVKVQAIDWSDDTPISETMKNLFKLGFSGNMESLRLAFELGVDARNSVMANNIRSLMIPTQNQAPICTKSIIFLGSLHIASLVEMPMGLTTYTSIADNPLVSELNSSSAAILDCRSDDPHYSQENINQCQSSSDTNNYIVNDIFSQSGQSLNVKFDKSTSQDGSAFKEISPALSENIMLY